MRIYQAQCGIQQAPWAPCGITPLPPAAEDQTSQKCRISLLSLRIIHFHPLRWIHTRSFWGYHWWCQRSDQSRPARRRTERYWRSQGKSCLSMLQLQSSLMGSAGLSMLQHWGSSIKEVEGCKRAVNHGIRSSHTSLLIHRSSAGVFFWAILAAFSRPPVPFASSPKLEALHPAALLLLTQLSVCWRSITHKKKNQHTRLPAFLHSSGPLLFLGIDR